ncbi:MAG: hypothetical protein KTR18_04540 [Acidiferrobacterales bacterium]|nr:hypothetical protein [Acidiferrobacterales bacterium]
MDLQITLLILGAIVIAAIYFFSRWQEKKRREDQSNRNTKSGRRGGRENAGSMPVAPAFERSEPGFGPDAGAEDPTGRFASLDTLEPPELRDFVDADQDGSTAYQTEDAIQYETPQSANEFSGVSTLLEHSSPGSEQEIEDEQPVDDSPNTPDEEDIPTLENMVSGHETENTFATAAASGDDADLGERFSNDLDVLTDMVDISQSDYELEDQSHQDHPTTSVSEAKVEDEPLDTDITVEEAPIMPEPPLLEEAEVVIPETITQTSFIDEDRWEAEGVEESSPSVEDEFDEAETEYAESRPSLKAFLGSIAPINKLKENIQNQLESVKAERERSLLGADAVSKKQKDIVIETDFAVHSNIAEEMTEEVQGRNDQIALGQEFVIDEEEHQQGLAREAEDIAAPSDTSNDDVAGQSQRDAGSDSEKPLQGASQESVQPDSVILPAEGFDKLSQIDYYVKLSGERDVSRDSVLAIYREGAAGIARTHSIYGLRLPEKVWRDLEQESEEARFGDLVVTIQLVDQDGLVTEDDMTRFSSLIMKLSESTGRGFSFMAPIENAHKQAEAIGRFRQQFDSIFVVNIRPLEGEMFEGAVIERCAKQIGLTADDNQFFARYKPVGKQKVCLYSLANMSDTGEFDLENMRAVRTRGVTFFTRPAINRSPGAVFAEMVDAAKAFASRIKGEVIAPGYEDLSTDDVEAIRRSIEKVAAEMESYGITPGSEEATRLFG